MKVRKRALPTLKNKESALRVEVKRAKDESNKLDEQLQQAMASYDGMAALWNEFKPGLVSVENVELSVKKIAGVKTPVLDEIKFKIENFSILRYPNWYLDGVEIIKKMVRIAIEREVFNRKMELLDYARKKTTQKVNLFEKVQIPGYEDAILKIKRFLEDEENLSKSAQKIVKTRQQEATA